MKKNFLEKLRLPFIFFLLLYACTSEQDYMDEKVNTQVEPLTISGAQAWFKQHYGATAHLKSASYENNEDSPVMNPDWNFAEIAEDSLWYAVESPLMMEENKGIHMMTEEVSRYVDEKSDKSLAKMLLRMVVMRNKKDGSTYSFVMAILPDLDYMLEKGGSVDENKYLTRQSDLSGLVFFYNIDGSFINGWVYKDGKITGGTHFSERQQPRQKAVTIIIIEYCWYQDHYVEHADGSMTYIGTNHHCDRETHYIYANSINESLYEGGGAAPELIGGGGGGINDDGIPPSSRNIENIQASEIVKSAMNTMMTNIKNDASAEKGRRERGFWVYYDKNSGRYYTGVEKIGPYVKGVGTHGSVVSGSAHPIHNGSQVPVTATPVAYIHGHTPLTFEDGGLKRQVGPSTTDRNWSRENSMPIIVIDYAGQIGDDGINYVKGGHNINDATKEYPFRP